jgi:exopolyphosphatase/guanosine-5'-triphosphate,3'-diphosphate pyrophosphatase
MVEYTVLVADGRTTPTVAVESPDQDLVLRTITALGLEGLANTCVAEGVKALLGWQAPRYAVLDVGTNSIKFTVGERGADIAPGVTVDTAVVTRLGEGVAETGELSEAAMARTVDAVAGLVEEALRDGPVEIAAVGTAGLRQAGNTEAFLVAVLERTGISIEVISGPEEARLAYLAAVSSLPLTGDRLLVFDSGGGSSQFTFGSRTSIDEQFSLDVGAVRYAERFGLTRAVDRATVDDALAAIGEDLASVAGRPRPDMVIAIGGTSTNLAAVSHGLATYDPDVVHGSRVDLAEIDRQIELYRQRSADERREIPGLQPARAEVILAGACIVRTILTTTGQEAVTVSDRGLRHGVVAERFSG